MSEPSRAERIAELMAWHGMARYADPDDLTAHLRPARRGDTDHSGDSGDSDHPRRPVTGWSPATDGADQPVTPARHPSVPPDRDVTA